jgi:hypothetical protein
MFNPSAGQNPSNSYRGPGGYPPSAGRPPAILVAAVLVMVSAAVCLLRSVRGIASELDPNRPDEVLTGGKGSAVDRLFTDIGILGGLVGVVIAICLVIGGVKMLMRSRRQWRVALIVCLVLNLLYPNAFLVADGRTGWLAMVLVDAVAVVCLMLSGPTRWLERLG